MGFQDEIARIGDSFRGGSAEQRSRIGIVVIVLVIAALAIFGAVSAFGISESEGSDSLDTIIVEDAAPKAEEEMEGCVVYITGCVANPGVVDLDAHARLSEAIEAVGGFTEDADRTSINLAQEVVDGSHIHVPSIAESQDASQESVVESPSSQGGGSSSQGGKVNLNTASKTELMTLSGIGESKAAKIIQYREDKGSFASVDELAQVSGIGEKTVEALRDSVCV